MQTGLTDALDDVDADPAAVFEAHDADSVDELVAAGSEPRTGQDDDLDALFAGGLEEAPPPECDRESTDVAGAPTDADDVLVELEQAAGSTEQAGTARDRAEPDAEATDAEVEAALAAAEEIYDGDVPDEIPFE